MEAIRLVPVKHARERGNGDIFFLLLLLLLLLLLSGGDLQFKCWNVVSIAIM
ncbi:hypothetical protein T440DRAFT_57908 [Plenodomus tracheiphilus IPT5]|uniref:Uncharacterized protein n=1 Tax=Plenodomus tracheiphilus IPT5 TaxID=1408161 RepID=A0A6A7B8S6_9PLEO|nr:hypothetical protein T440DRAFT_57908 [Plenodomus tracheiphilus IPT5]